MEILKMRVGRYIIRRQDRHAAITFVEQKLNQESQWIEGDKKQQLTAKQEEESHDQDQEPHAIVHQRLHLRHLLPPFPFVFFKHVTFFNCPLPGKNHPWRLARDV